MDFREGPSIAHAAGCIAVALQLAVGRELGDLPLYLGAREREGALGVAWERDIATGDATHGLGLAQLGKYLGAAFRFADGCVGLEGQIATAAMLDNCCEAGGGDSGCN